MNPACLSSKDIHISQIKHFLQRFVAQGKCFSFNEFYDLRGSVTAILGPDGSYTKGYDYDEFGNTEGDGDSDFKNELAFTSAVSDTSSGLYYMNARYYNPKTGRFLTQDAIGGDNWTNNLYSYCGNNPVSFIDPTGYNRDDSMYPDNMPVTTPEPEPEPTPTVTTHPDQAAADAEEALKKLAEYGVKAKDIYDARGKTPEEILEDSAYGIIPDTVFYLWGLDIWKDKVIGRQKALTSNLWNVGMDEYNNGKVEPYVIYLMEKYKIDDDFKENAKWFYDYSNIKSGGTVNGTNITGSLDYCKTPFEKLSPTQQDWLIGGVAKMEWGGMTFNEAVMPDIGGVIYDTINYLYDPSHIIPF